MKRNEKLGLPIKEIGQVDLFPRWKQKENIGYLISP
jgi:hypothetical protein